MSKVIDLSKTVYELVNEYPELPGIMANLGFSEMTKKVALNTAGRVMTIPKGCEVKGVELSTVIETLEKNGFEVTGIDVSMSKAPTPEERNALLESYVKRLSEGEDLETVRADFVKNFKDVDAAEIARAEQSLIQKGAKIHDVQRLCDVHSALFHGATKQEQIDNAEQAVMQSLRKEKAEERNAAYQKLRAIPGHPLQILNLENEAITKELSRMRDALDHGDAILETLEDLRQIAVHYAKKGDLIYPVLKKDYGFSGPSDVMWGVDDEIRDAFKKLSKEAQNHPDLLNDAQWRGQLDKALTRAEEMVYKENNILFPLCAEQFSKEVWQGIARDMKDYEFCFIDPVPLWDEASINAYVDGKDDEIVLSSGHMTIAQLEALLNTIPLEITFIDDSDINRYFNENKGPKLFKRPLAALDREVYTCHPPKVEPMVRMVISKLKSGEKDSFEIWNERAGEPVLIRYMGVRNQEGKYLGTMEVVQHMGFAKEHFMDEKGS